MMDRAADEEPRVLRLVRQLADSSWQKRAEAVEELVADGKVSSEAALETIQAVLPVLQSAGTPWRARAAALRVLKGFDQEAHLKALAHLVAPSEATMEHSQDIEDEMETDDDRVVADIPIPIQLEGNRRQDDEVSSMSSFSSLGKTESEIAEDWLEAVQLPDSVEALLSAVAAHVNREEPPDCAVTDQIEIARVARVAFEGGPKMQLAAVKLLAEFGGSFDLHRLLKEAVKKEDAQDGFLDKKDLKKYALSEFKFTLPDPVADKIIKHLTAPGAKGVAKDDFQRIKVQIGIARDRQIDLQRKKRMDELKDQLQDRIEKEVKTGVDEITTLNASIEEKWQKLKEPDVKSADKIAMLDKIDPEVAQVREKISSQQQIMKQIKESTEITLKDWIQSQLSEFYSKLKKVDTSSQKIGREASRLRDTAGKQHEKELQALQKRGLEIIRQYQKAKDLLNDAVFEAMSASNGKERVVNETSFLNFFAKCGKECSNGEAVDIPSEEELRCLLCSWDSEGHLDEDRVQEILRRCMKVVNKTTLTDGVSSKSSVVRKLEVNEVLMLQSVPCKDSEIDVLRVKVQALNDGAEGWVTMSGNQGTEYLKEGGNIFKVKKETLLTEDLDITAGAKEKASQLKDTDRRLLIGELVEVKSPMQEQSGMKRFRCTALKDGASGWATVVNSQGTVYLEVK